MNIVEKLLAIQSNLNAPKNLFNRFGNYSYRNAEGILEAVKPLLNEYKCALIVTDDIIPTGSYSVRSEENGLITERDGSFMYVKSTARLIDCEKPDSEERSVAFAREPMQKKGMDDSQITGAASSYARKYALNGLFCIDDTKDADDTNTHGKEEKSKEPAKKAPVKKAPAKKAPVKKVAAKSATKTDLTK